MSNKNINVIMSDVQQLKILLAEDNPINQKVVLKILQRNGYEADVAQNGLEVLTALESCSYDVILMDIHMPEMDGITATRCIRGRANSEEQRQPYIVAVTADVLQESQEKYRASGMNNFVGKPI